MPTTKIIAFFQLIRFPNLIFIALTQLLFYFQIIVPYCLHHGNHGPSLQPYDFFLLLCSSVLIAAGGYIINDYFDIDIDNVNKPQRQVVGKTIKRRWAMLLHMVLSLFGLYLTAVVSMHLGNMLLLAMNFISVLLLWFYSSTFKKRMLIGNIIISFLTAWVVGVLFIAEIKINDVGFMRKHQELLGSIYKFTLVYSGFAFIVSLIREVVKDMEDIEGDRRFGCTTLPIVWGIPAAKIFVGVWLVVLMGLLSAFSIYALLHAWFWGTYSLAIAMVLYVLLVFKQLIKSQSPSDFSTISRNMKLIMLVGILSMLLYIFQ